MSQPDELSRTTFWPRPGGKAPIERDVFCAKCGYNLRGLPGGEGFCPECGQAFEEFGATSAGLPWEKRDVIGGLEAFWQTIVMVIAKPDEFCAQMWERGPLSDSDARRFRRICVAIGAGTGIVAWVFLAARAARIGFSEIDCTAIAIGIWLWLELASAQVGRFMKKQTMPEGRYQRVFRLAQFTAAPLALLPIQIPLAMIALYVRRLNLPISPLALPAYAIIAEAHVAVWVWTCLAFVYGTMDVKISELAGFGLTLLAVWAVEGLVFLIGIPALLHWVVKL